MKNIRTDITIYAPVKSVWQIITDFQRYKEWNPYILEINGKPVEDAKLKIKLQPENLRIITYRATLVKLVPEQKLAWLGDMYMPGLFDGKHIFELSPLSEKETLFIHSEEFAGILTTNLLKKYTEKIKADFEKMNWALKSFAEREYATYANVS